MREFYRPVLSRAYLSEALFRKVLPESNVVEAGSYADLHDVGRVRRQGFLVDYGSHQEIIVGNIRIYVYLTGPNYQRFTVIIESGNRVYQAPRESLVAYSMESIGASIDANELMSRAYQVYLQDSQDAPEVNLNGEMVELNCSEVIEVIK